MVAGSGSFAGARKREDTKYGKETRGKVKGFGRSIRGTEEIYREGKQKLDEEYFGGERILHVGRIPRVRASGLRRILGFAVLYLWVSYEVPVY